MSASGAGDVSGTWSGNPFYMVVKQEGGKLTGTIGPGKKNQAPIEDGVVEGERLTFRVGAFRFDLRVAAGSGDEIRGEARMNQNEPIRVYLKKAMPVASEMAAAMEFDAASVKRTPLRTGPDARLSVEFTTGRIRCSNISLKSLIVRAYEVKDYQVAGPEWMSSELYDVVATMPPATSADDALLMLRSLLAERFELKLQRETRELPVYVLVAAKGGAKLKAVERNWEGGGENSPGHLVLPSMTMEGLATVLSWRVDRPVVDMTGMTGHFAVKLEWSSTTDATGGSIFTALQEQLGLKLEARKVPMEMLVAEHVARVPVGN